MNSVCDILRYLNSSAESRHQQCICSFKILTKMIQVYLLTALVIYLPYADATTGLFCIRDSAACSSIISYQCKAGYRIHITCNPGSSNSASCPHTSECMACNTTTGFGTCNCHRAFYEYHGFCYSKHDLHEPCYSENSCRYSNSVCSNSSGGRCVCRPGYYVHHYGTCAELRPIGWGCYADEECRDQHARCVGGPPICLCMDGYYEHKGYCTAKHGLYESCYNADGCRDTNSMCSFSSNARCVCRQGYYIHHNRTCAELEQLGSGCYDDNQCRDEHARCIRAPSICSCMDGYYENRGSCILKSYLGGICHNHDGCTGEGVVCSSLYNGTCSCNSTHIYYKDKCYHMPDSPKNLTIFNVTTTSVTVGFEKPNEVFGELLGYVLKITLADTGICVIEYIIRCTSGCIEPFPNLTDLTTCLRIIQYKTVGKQDLIMMQHDENTLDPGTVYWVSVAAVGQYGKGIISVINASTLNQVVTNAVGRSEPYTTTTIIIASIVCGTLIVIVLTAAGTIIIIKRRRASKCKNDTVVDSTYMDLPVKTNEPQYDTIVVTSTY